MLSLCLRKKDTGADDPSKPIAPEVVVNPRLKHLSLLLHQQIDSLNPNETVGRDTLAVNLAWKDRDENTFVTINENDTQALSQGRDSAQPTPRLLNDRPSARSGSLICTQPSLLTQPTLTARHRAGSLTATSPATSLNGAQSQPLAQPSDWLKHS